MVCEKCWSEAFRRSCTSEKLPIECYFELLEERKNNPCSPQEQAGEYWDEINQCDIRLTSK